jgi:hypothetical protein
MPCTVDAPDRRKHLRIVTKSAVLQPQGGSEVEQCTLRPGSTDVVHLVRIYHLRGYYQKAQVKARVEGAGQFPCAEFSVPQNTNGTITWIVQSSWEDQSLIPCTFNATKFVHKRNGTQKIKVEVYAARTVWDANAPLIRVDCDDLEFSLSVS